MAVSEMKKLSLVALKKDADKLLNDLMWNGSVEVSDASESSETALAQNTAVIREISDITAKLSKIDNALGVLKPYEKAPKGLFSKKKQYKRSDYEASDDIADEAVALSDKVSAAFSAISSKSAEINALTSSIGALEPWKNYDIPLDVERTERTDVILATYPASREIGELAARFDGVTDEYEISEIGKDDAAHYLFVLVNRAFTNEILRVSADIGFAKQELSRFGTGLPSAEIVEYTAARETLEREIEEHKNELSEYAGEADKLRFAYDALSAKLSVTEAKQKMIMTDSAVIMTGWVPAFAAENISHKLDEIGCAYEFTDPEDGDEDIPVLLQNGRLSSNFESVVEMYSLPMYKTFDPTKIMSVFYFIIFGMMFGDVIYGLILSVGAFLMTKLLDLGKETKKLVMVFAICGVSSMFWGVMFGSYAGNLLGGLIKPVAFDIIEQPIYFLVLAFVIGAAHLLVAMGIRFYILCREHKFFDAVVEIGSWYLIFAGIALLAAVNKTAGIILVGIGAAIIILFKGRDSKNPVLRIFKGLLGLYDIVNFASDLLSYSRIMALGMSSAIIAMVVNTLADLPGKSPVGIIFMIIILLLGHIINIALNILGTFVHTSRLQYIEFFGKFYVDGGRRFRPLAMEPKYTNIID